MNQNQIDKNTLILWKQIARELPDSSFKQNVETITKSVAYDYVAKVVTIEFTDPGSAEYVRKVVLKTLERAFADVLKDSISVCILPEKITAMDLQETLESRAKELEEANFRFYQEQGLDHQSIASIPDQGNQGLGAIYQWNGLNFRSKSEIKIAEALDSRGVLYFPNARGRLSQNYSRVNREADFLVCYEGRWGILECDGEAYHQSAANDHARDLLWNAQGIWFIKRFSSDECFNNPAKIVDLFLKMLKLFHAQNSGESKP